MISGSCTTAKWQPGSVYEQLENLKRDLVRSALKDSKGNITLAARSLRVSRNVMQGWIHQLGLRALVEQGRSYRRWARKLSRFRRAA